MALCRIEDEGDLIEVLHLVYRSLWDSGNGMIADGHLLDILRRAHVFGMALLKLDLRQESTQHTALLAAITKDLGLGDYGEWSEDEKVTWLVRVWRVVCWWHDWFSCVLQLAGTKSVQQVVHGSVLVSVLSTRSQRSILTSSLPMQSAATHTDVYQNHPQAAKGRQSPCAALGAREQAAARAD